ncbi:prenyltransferase/squalene oxidase repeat-containing protein [Streptomyces sp. NPDC059477]|uniref:prenyltransferase/squalene oxidase repeat-containing protein n=1 Tax=Streptomyces sp. NPDC059477 TaxID=3346847 RepID=UPI00368A8410
MYVRRSAAVLAAALGIGAVAAPLAQADSASPSPSASASLPAGLFGAADPTYDGVWRQSLALLAQTSVGIRPAAVAVDWLTGQQCGNGGFAAFRAEPGTDCDTKTALDSNSTAAAVQALAALGDHEAATGKAVTWLKSAQNADGGWGYTPGGPSDANSTGVVIGALAAAGEQPAEVQKDGKSPYDALLALSVPCADADGGGAFAYQPDDKGDLVANADATAAGVLGALGKGLNAEAGADADADASPDADAPADAKCADATTPEQAAANGAAWLTGALAEDGHLISALPGAEDQPDYGNTADAVVALAAQGEVGQARAAMTWLEKNAADWAKQSGPAAYAQLVLAAQSVGTAPGEFGGEALISGLNATGPAPEATDGLEEKRLVEKEDTAAESADDDSPFGVWWYVGVFGIVGVGIGFLVSNRSRGNQR